MKIYISKQNGKVSFFYVNGTDFFEHSMDFQLEETPEDDDILRVAVNSNPFFDIVYMEIFGIKVSSDVLESLCRSLKIEVKCEISSKRNSGYRYEILDSDTIYLGFSGGFDSLAAKAILPKGTRCVSINYGEDFKRESDFFSKYDTSIINWDLRRRRLGSIRKFNESPNWRFMLAPMTLFKRNKRNIIVATGTILEASPFWFSSDEKRSTVYSDFGLGLGVSLINPVAGLTEYSTTLIVMKDNDTKTVQESLASLAAPDSFKYHRKKCLIATVNNEYSEITIPKQKYILGSNFTDDLVTLYFCWKKGTEWTKKYFAEAIPKNIIVHDMSFVEKLNVHNMLLIDSGMREKLIHNIKSYGIKQYEPSDYLNLDLVRNQLISKIYE